MEYHRPCTTEVFMPVITTTSGHNILIDDCDMPWATKMRWNISPRGYARAWVRTGLTRKNVHLHRLVLGAKGGEIIDHINRDKLDNRRENLRVATAALNAMNRKSCGCSKYKGVAKHKKGWQVYVGGKYVGLFADELSAALAYDTAAKQMYGENAVTNKELKLI